MQPGRGSGGDGGGPLHTPLGRSHVEGRGLGPLKRCGHRGFDMLRLRQLPGPRGQRAAASGGRRWLRCGGGGAARPAVTGRSAGGGANGAALTPVQRRVCFT